MSDQRIPQKRGSAMNRRTFLKTISIASGSMVVACQRPALTGVPTLAFDHDAIIIGTGFGATVTATQLALVNPNRKRNIDYQPQDERLNFNTAPFPIFATRGPINASHVMFHDGKLIVNFEDATIPPMFAQVVRDMLDLLTNAADSSSPLSRVSGLWKAVVQDIAESPDPRKPKNFWTEHEMLQNTFFFNLMGRDEARGCSSSTGPTA
jgi:hypothetical protein